MPEKVSDPLLQSLREVAGKPQLFLVPDGELSKKLLESVKWTFEQATAREPKDVGPLKELYVDGFGHEQIWEQLQLRNAPMISLLRSKLEQALPAEAASELKKGRTKRKAENEGDEEENDEVDDEEFGSEGDEFDGEDEELDGELEDEADFDGELEEDEEEEGLEDEDADLDADLDDEDADLDDDDDVADEEGDMMDEDEAEGKYNDDDPADDEEGQTRRGRWTPLDDEFFSVAEMERFAELGEARDIDRVNRNPDELDEWNLNPDYFLMNPDELDDSEEEDEMDPSEIRYEDFFAPPAKKQSPFERGDAKGAKGKGSVRFNEKVKERRFKKDEPISGSEVDESEEELDDDDDEQDESGAGKKAKKSKNIFDLEDEDDDEMAGMSKFEKQQAIIKKQIEELETEMVAEKPWALKGEVKAKERPVNSLLEEDLEVEHASRPAPVITEETTATLEDMIKQRIKDSLFDDVERRLPPREKTYDPNRGDFIDENKSSKSLSELYEEDYRSKTSAEPIKTAKQEAVEGAHKEIDDLCNQLFSSLDALANYQYTPDAPRVELEIVPAPNVPALMIEEIVPASVSDATLAAPEEVYAGGVKKAQEEMSAVDRKKERLKKKKMHKKQKTEREKERKAREASKTRISDSVVGAPQTKEKAMKQLLKQKNVTIVADGKRGKGSAAEAAAMKGKGKAGRAIRANFVDRGSKLGDKKAAGEKVVTAQSLKL
ncbi:u3 small nucleolar ribonucleoprotein MPP10 [Phlyctochytrium bullatum]|nr:u3 small nucleolar ribonucleoprotein MPP10 [Phlyctochytrium bullatum]